MVIMNQENQQEAFAHELDALIDRFVQEFSLTVASAVGVLEMAKLDLFSREMENLSECASKHTASCSLTAPPRSTLSCGATRMMTARKITT